MKRYIALILGLALLAGCTTAPAQQPQTTGQTASQGDLVAVEYVGTLASGQTFDESQGEPIEFVLGQGQLIPGFEQEIAGMQVGEQKEFTLSPAEAYGERTPNNTQQVPIDQFGDQQPEEGMLVQMTDPRTQQPTPAQVIEVGDQNVTLDLNHPLAGEELTFSVELVDISDAPAQQPVGGQQPVQGQTPSQGQQPVS